VGALLDLENATLVALALPYANPGGAISWPPGADFGQAKVDWAINRQLTRLVSDLGDIELLTQAISFPSITNQYSYTLQNAVGQPATAIGSFATGTVTLTGTVAAGQVATVTIGGTAYTYHVPTSSTTFAQIIGALIKSINAGTQINSASTPTNTLAPVNQALNTQSVLTLMAGSGGTGGNATTLTASGSGSLTLTASGATLAGGTAANQPIRMVRRVFYQANGQLFRLELEPGARLISWQEFNRRTGAGYTFPFNFSTWPSWCSVSPRRDHLFFSGGPSQYGDTITVEYCPIVTQNAAIPASNWGYLVNTTDIPLLPEDAQDALWMGAAAFLQPNARQVATGELYSKKYAAEVQRIKDNYARDSAGDALILRPAEDAVMTSGYDTFLSLG
jgi:hypothetical protein